MVLSVFTVLTIMRPVFNYLEDPKGFRKYPSQNPFSGFTDISFGLEKWRSQGPFHTARLHEMLVKSPVMRLGPNWLSFGSSRAVKDIYGYGSPCLKSALYDALQGGGQHLVNISSRSLHSSRRKMVATAYAPKNIEAWEPKIAETTSLLISKMDALCTTPLALEGFRISPQEDLTFDGNLWPMLYCFEGVIKIGLSKDVGFLAQGSDMIEIEHPDGKTETINAIDSLHGGSRAASTLVYDVPNYGLLAKISKAVSPWYAKQWAGGAKWRLAVEKLTKERIERYKNGEVLDDLVQPMLEDRTGAEPDISALDRVAEIDQMGTFGLADPRSTSSYD